MKIILAAIFLCHHSFVNAQVVESPDQPPWLGLTACNKRFSDPFSVQLNPASLAFAETALAGICSEVKYLQTDLRCFYGAAVLPMPSGGSGLSIGYVATQGYSQSKIGLAYAKKLGARFSLGLGFNYHRLSVVGYGSRNALTAALGCQFTISEKISVFFSSDNLPAGKFGKSSDEKLGLVFSAGLGDIISEKVYVSARIKKKEESAAVIYFAVNYALNGRLNLFAALSVNNAEGFFGSSVLFRNMELRQAVGWKQGLGISPSLAVLFHKNRTE